MTTQTTSDRSVPPGAATGWPLRLILLLSSAVALAGCGGGAEADTGAAKEQVSVTKDDAAAALLPAKIKERGTLVIGGGFGAGSVPLGFYEKDNKTVTGIEPDIARLIAGKLGLKPDIQITSWENLFLGLDSAKYDAGFSNITVTEERKEKYDFATYRSDLISFETKKGTGWKVAGRKDIAGKKIAVGSGTNQEKILVDWNNANIKEGLKAASISYYQNQTDTYLALSSGRIDGYFGPNPSVAHHVKTSGQTDSVGTFSGAGAGLKGLIAATTKKDSGLVKALQAAIQSAIKDGSYAKVLNTWNVTDEAVTQSQINPPGLPKEEAK